MRFVAVGEAMIELSGDGGDLWRMGVAGDTLNTAWYARTRLPIGWSVDYVTRIGLDPFSDRIVAFLTAAGIGTEHVQRDPARGPGLYAISLTGGERLFTYWRGQSAARKLADDPAALSAALAQSGLVYLSGITLAILAPSGREALLEAVAACGAPLAFDPNYRPRLWERQDEAREWTGRLARMARYVLPSADDEAAAFGDASPKATVARYRDWGVPELVVKNAGGPIHLWDGAGEHRLSDLPAVTPLDSTGAGDSFNAAYLSARLAGQPPVQAVRAAHALASRVVQGYGGLVPQALEGSATPTPCERVDP
jgi:2-dehydro-3-deoxygluconokinase